MADISISKINVSDTIYDIEDTTARSGLEGKVDKVAGKGLSTEDYTTAEKTKLASLKGVDVVSSTELNAVGENVKIWIDNSESYAELDDPEIVQVPGQSTMKVMSQKATTDAIAEKSVVSVSATGTATDEVQYITIDGVEKKLAGGGSGEPDAYLKNATTLGNTLTLTKKDNSTVVYTPTEQYQGTVTSVGAGTGLSISGTATVNPTVNVASGYKLPTTTEWGNKLDKNSSITGATKTKITYDSNGLVTAGADLAASDIPNLAASKITSGTFADDRIASASTWNAKQDALTASNNITIDASNNISALKYYKQSEVTGVAGSGTSTTTYVSTKYDVTDTNVSSYYDGMVVSFVLPVAGIGTAGSVFQIGSLGYKPIVFNTNSAIGTRYPVGGQITMVYNSVQTASAYLSVGSKSSITGCWQVCDYDADTKNYADTICETSASTAAKTASHYRYVATANSYCIVTTRYANTAKSALTLNINSVGAKPIYINGTASSSTNYTLPAATYIVYYDGTNYYFNTDGKIPGNIGAGTVTSVQVQAGTGLSSSQSSAQTGILNTTISVASGYKLPTTSEWSGKADTSALTSHTDDSSIHVTASDKSTWSGKQNALSAGSNIQINGATISATDTTYTAGSGIDITNNVISSVGISATVTQDIGTSTTDVMSQNATTNQVKYLDKMIQTYALDSPGQAAYYIPDIQVTGKYVRKDGSNVGEHELSSSRYVAIPLDSTSYYGIKYNDISTTSSSFQTCMAVIAQGSTAGSAADDWMSYNNVISGWNNITTYSNGYAVFNCAKVLEKFPNATHLFLNMLDADYIYKVIYTGAAGISSTVNQLKNIDAMLVPSGASYDSSYFSVDTSTGWVSVVGIIDVYYGVGGQYRRFQNAENVCQITGAGTASIIYKPSTNTFYYGENQSEGVVVATTRGQSIYPKGNVTVKYSDNTQLKTLQAVQAQVESISTTDKLDAWLVSPNGDGSYIYVDSSTGAVSVVGIVDVYYGPGAKYKRFQNTSTLCTITGAGSSTLIFNPDTMTVRYADSQTSDMIIATTYGKNVYPKGNVDVVYSDGTRIKGHHRLATQVNLNTDRIDALEAGGGGLPTFAKSAALTTYQRILSWAGNDQICMIGQVTDVHSAGTDKYKVVGYMNELNSMYGFDLIGNFGDIGLDTTSETSETGYELVTNTKMKMRADAPWIFMKGNHDSGRVLQLSDSQLSTIFVQPFAKQHSNIHESGKCYGYIDLDYSKVKVIYLNTSDNALNAYAMNATQLTWLASTLAAVQAGWNVVVLSHLCVDDCGRWTSYPGDASGAGFDTLRSILAAFVSKTAGSNPTTGVSWDFTSVPTACKLVCSFAGDSHFNNTAVTNGVRYVVRQGYGGISASEIPSGGTTDSFDYTSQVLFDVLCIKSSGTAKVFRIGAGGDTRDLEFTF